MKVWRVVLPLLTTLALASSLTMGPVTLANNNRFINFTRGASPDNSLLKCGYHVESDEQVARVSWDFSVGKQSSGTYTWEPVGTPIVTGRLEGKVNLTRNDGELELTELRYDLVGEYSCSVELTTGEVQKTAPWEVLIVDSVSHLSRLQNTVEGCTYTSSYSTLAMFPEPSVRAGLYSMARGGFYDEIPKSAWKILRHENGSVTYSYSNYGFELNSQTPEDISFYVSVGVMKGDGNFIPVSNHMDKHLILHHLGCPEPRLEAYQRIFYHKDTITCRGEHRDTEATVTCREGYHADGAVDEVTVKCHEDTHKWLLEDGTPARREHLGCVINHAPGTAALSTALLGVGLVFIRLCIL